MAMSRKRPFRRRTSRTLNNRIRRIDEQVERKALGKWYYVSSVVDINIGSTNYGAFISLPRPSNKLEIYGMDLLIGIVMDNSSPSHSQINGAVMVCHDREGQDPADFVAANNALPAGQAGDALARPRAFVPFQLVGQQIQQRAITIPYRFFRGHKIVLNENQRLLFWFSLISTTPAGVKLEASLHGRYRYIQTHS